MCKGQLFILSGPSGSGKDTVLESLFQVHPEIRFSRSCVTRPMREGETADGKYQFISKAEFLADLDAGKFLEYNEYVNNYYGTPKAPVEAAIAAGADMILEIDVNGAANVRKKMPEAVSIFIMPPSFAVLQKRLSRRGTESEKLVHSRLETAIGEIRRAGEYDYIVVNDRLEDAVAALTTIIMAERCRRHRQMNFIDEVLNDVESCNW